MTKLFTRKPFSKVLRLPLLAFITFIFSLNVNGQILWGAGSSDVASDEAGRFVKEFSTENAWKATAISSPEALWTRTTTGVSQGQYWSEKSVVFKSPSLTDGAALFDSDYLDTKNITPPHKGELLSPKIDLTGLTDGDKIEAKLFLYYRYFDISELSLGFSSDGGSTWTNFSLLGLGNTPNSIYGQDYVTIRLKGATTGVTDFSNCRLKLVFDGDSYFAMADNISIQKTPPYDIAFPPYGAYAGQSTICPSAYAQIPLRYAVKANDNDFLYAAIVYNDGGLAIPASANPKLTCELLKSTGITWNSVFKKEIAIGRNIPSGDTVKVQGDLSVAFNEVFKTNGAGSYRFTYHLSHDLTDASASNDDKQYDFIVSEEYGWYSTVPLNEAGFPIANTTAFPSSSPGEVVQTLEQGAYFYFPDQTDLEINSVRYSGGISQTTEFRDYQVLIKVYNVKELDKLESYTLEALGMDTVKASADKAGKYTDREVSIYGINDSKIGYRLKNETGIYVITVSQTNPDGLMSDNRITKRYIQPGAYKTDNVLGKELSFNYTMFLKVGIGSPGGPETVKYYTGYSGGEGYTPSIGVKTINSTALGTKSFSQSLNENNVTQFPNPVEDRLNLDVKLDQLSDDATFILTDINGMILHMENYKQVQNMNYALSTEQLIPGTYFIYVRTDQGNISKKFIKY